jgi:ABC-2 type transport system permease protein
MKRMGAEQIKKYFRIWKLHAKAGLMQRMAARFNFFLITFAVTMQMFVTLLFIKIIFSFVSNISGWNFYEALIIVASYMLVEGLSWVLCAELAGITKNIRSGNLDGMITKPISTQFLVSVWRADPEDWARIITAIIVLAFSISHLALAWSEVIINGVLYFILIFNAFIITYSLTLIIKSQAFWVVETGNLWMMTNQVIRVSQYPTDIFFHRIVRLLFSTVIPLAFMATIPAKIFIRGFDFWLISASIALAAVFFYASRRFWKFALRHYSSASS